MHGMRQLSEQVRVFYLERGEPLEADIGVGSDRRHSFFALENRLPRYCEYKDDCPVAREMAYQGTANKKMTAECKEKKIYVTAINTGGQVGAIANPQLYEKRGTEEKLSDIKLKLLGAETGLSQILKPGDGVVLEYQGVIAGQEDSKFPSKDGPKNCLLEIRYAMLNFEKVAQSPGQDTVTCPCPENNP